MARDTTHKHSNNPKVQTTSADNSDNNKQPQAIAHSRLPTLAAQTAKVVSPVGTPGLELKRQPTMCKQPALECSAPSNQQHASNQPHIM